jgi:CRP-like cAMP-binding protein
MTLWQDQEHDDRERRRGFALTSAWPELAHVIPPEDRALAERVLMAPMLTSDDETLSELIAAAEPTAFAFLVVRGVVLKETVFAARSAMELLTVGDVLAPTLTASRQAESPAVSRYIAHGPASVAVLDQRFRQAARRWPGLSDLLHDRLGLQTHRASMHLATLHQPRVEERIVACFTDLAERSGRMTADGVVIEIALTHDLIGRLVGAQRPTVSLALAGLASAGTLVRFHAGAWRLAPDAIVT